MPAHSVTQLKTIGLVLVTSLWLFLTGCTGLQTQQEGGGQESVKEESLTGSFVGEIPEANTFVALVAQEPQEGEDQQQLRAYLCDGTSINEWFNEGSVEETEFDLTSDDGARVVGSLKRDVDSSWVSGQVFLADGTVLPFGAPPATGIAGLYEGRISEGELSGTSETGGRIEGQVGDEVENGRYPTSGIITLPEGQSQGLEWFVTADASGELRFIVLADGRIKGGFKKGEGAGFIDTDTD
jgi:hypothetical protein